MRRPSAAIAVLGVLLASCGGAEPEPLVGGSQAPLPAETEQDMDTKPDFTVPSGEAPPQELVVEDLVVGDGPEAENGDNVAMHYVGKAWSTGEQFDASWDRGQTFDFDLGEGGVIAGWDQGIVGMKVGGRRMLTIPPDLAYGDAGAGDAIGPGETLVFVVDLVEVRRTFSVDTPEARPEFDVASDQEPPAELVTEDLLEGDPEHTAQPGDIVSMHYVGKAWSTGEEFDASWERGQPLEFEIGGGRLIPGWEEGIVGMQLGGRRMLTIPPDLAYGDAGAGDVIGPGETLVFVVDLVAIRRPLVDE